MYKKQCGALAMTETKPVNNPTTRFTPSWEKSNPSKPEPILLPYST